MYIHMLGNNNAKQKHFGCIKVQGQSEAALQTGATKILMSVVAKKLFIKNLFNLRIE